MNFNTKYKSEIVRMIAYAYKLAALGHIVTILIDRSGRTSKQRAAKWLYLTRVANELTERGEVIDFKGVISPYTKDSLQENVWKSIQNDMFPNKKRLNTKEYSQVSEAAVLTFSIKFDVDMEWPSQDQVEQYRKTLMDRIDL